MTYSEDNLDYRWRAVSEWGQPDPETCRWGMRWKAHEHGPEAISRVAHYLPDPSWWQPLPPPCDEVMPPPEPKWQKVYGGPMGETWVGLRGPEGLTDEQAEQAADILNAVDAGETVGRVRPWQEAPDDNTAVLAWFGDGWGWSTGRHARRYELSWMAQPAPPEEVER